MQSTLPEGVAAQSSTGRHRWKQAASLEACSMTKPNTDAQRYQWIKAQLNLELRSQRIYGTAWTELPTGRKYYPTHQLNVNDTGFNGIEHLDDLIDRAMEMFPLDADGQPTTRPQT